MAKKLGAWVATIVVVAVAAGGYAAWRNLNGEGLPEGIAGGNGRIEATEIDIAAKTAGRISEIFVNEGDFIDAGEKLVQMDTRQLEAQKREAEASLRSAKTGLDTANATIEQAKAEKRAAEAIVEQRQAALNSAQATYERAQRLVQTNVTSRQALENAEATALQAKAGLAAAQASSAAASAAISTAQSQLAKAEAAIDAAQASIDYIQTIIDDSVLTAPRPGRVQYLVAQPGEVVAAGGRVLNIVDLTDVYMNFFLPTEQAGRTAIGAEARLVLDAAPQLIIPASISYVSDVAQFTPKAVETEIERQKLMFRVKARIAPELLAEHIDLVKTGLPGMAYVRHDAATPWPQMLDGNLAK
ncbi:UNVERIFIED_ORG: HlyD family secretion protein [Martelella mediterranea]